MYAFGLWLQGRIFPFDLTQPLVALAAFADIGVGAAYLAAKLMGAGRGDVIAITYEYGNAFLIVAGLLNMLVVIDAFDVAADRISIVDIKDTVKVLHPLDGNLDAARAAIRATIPRGGTALYNGVYLTLKELAKQRPANGEIRRQAIAVLSDGDDTASLVDFDDVMDVAKRSGVAVYTIALRSAIDIRQASASGRRYFSNSEYSMKALAQETGARAFFPTEIGELAGVYGSIAEELAGQYALGYTSKNPKRDGGYRRVIVQVAQHPGTRTRTRAGYVAAPAERVAIR